MSSEIEVGRDGRVAILIMTPADGLMTETTVTELDQATASLINDTTIRAIVLTGGHDGIFIRHYHVGELERIGRGLRERGASFDDTRAVKPRPIDRLFERLAETDKIIVAAINGTAMGGGFELALACDLRVGQSGPFDLGLPEINIGLLPGAGGTQRLARLVGPARALEMILRGRTVGPDEALRLGLVHEVAPDGALARAQAIAHEIAGKSPLAVAHIKRLIRREAEQPLESALALERTLFLDLLVSDPAIDLMTAMNAGELDIRRGQN